MKKLIPLILFIIAGCAQINPLTGGAEDTIAPQIDSAKTFPLSGSTNFNGDEIRIKFKEYIKLKNPGDNIIITPQLKEKPTITSHNKKLSIQFNETLEENTTYTISFNRAVQDITENNDSIFQFVFSTGDYIDSLSVEGMITDGFTNKGEKDFLVALYHISVEAQFDSIPYKFRPTYIGQSSASGRFEINYLKEGIYYLFVIEDKNRNLQLDQGEKLGFLPDRTIHVKGEEKGIEIKAFLPEEFEEIRINETRFDYPGKIEFILSAPESEAGFNVHTTMGLIREETNREDSIVYWLADHPTSKMRFYVTIAGEADTLKPVYKGIPEAGKEPDLKISNNIIEGQLSPGVDLELIFSEPIDSVIQGSLHFYREDSSEISLTGQIVNVRRLVFPTAQTDAIRVKVDSAAVWSIYGNTNQSKTQLKFETLDSSYFGNLIFNIDTLYQTPVLVELTDSKGERVKLVPFEQRLLFNHLPPGNYGLRLIFDDNNNGEWSTGSLKEGVLPEKVLYFKGEINIKSKWDREIDWNLKTIQDGNI